MSSEISRGAARLPRGVSIHTVLTTVVAALIVVATGGVGVWAYVTTRGSLESAWHDLADAVAGRTAQQVSRHLAGADPAVSAMEALVDAGTLDVADVEQLVRRLETGLRANPSISWLTFADTDGNVAGVARWPVGDEVRIRRTIRRRDATGMDRRDWEERDGRWELVLSQRTDFDPRVRPFYRAAVQQEDGRGVWVDPYLFVSRKQPGINYALPSRRSDGSLRGVWSADFECGPLSEFLATLTVGETGRVYVLDLDGRVVAHPTGAVAGADRILRAGTHPDPMLRGAWRHLLRRDDRWTSFEFDEYLVTASPFPDDTGVPWMVLIVVPAEELFGVATRQVGLSLAVTLIVALIAIWLGLLFARHLSGSVRAVESEMGRIARFDLSDRSLAERRSLFLEINRMSLAHDHMKQGLRSFGRYVPRQLVERLLRSGREARIGGEVREISVLFSDIAGFTPIVEASDPDTIMAALSEYFSRLNGPIGELEGTIGSFLGDAIMAFWGAPDPVEDHALRACRAALRMRAVVDELVAEAPAKGFPPLPTRIGVNTGTCLVGNIGAAERFSYTVIGDPVNLAARIEGLNKTYGTTILVGARTAALVGSELLLRPADWVRVKGRNEALLVYELLGERSDANPELVAAVERYTRALHTYRERAFLHAAAAFEETPWPAPLAPRARAFAADPPPADWDGAHTMQTK